MKGRNQPSPERSNNSATSLVWLGLALLPIEEKLYHSTDAKEWRLNLSLVNLSCADSTLSCSSLGCCWCKRVKLLMHASERSWSGAAWAVGTHEICHPGPNWRSLIMWGRPVVNSPVFLFAVWPSSRSLLHRWGSQTGNSLVILTLLTGAAVHRL